MPYLNLTVNFPVPNSKELSLKLAQAGGKILGKPLEYMSASITENQSLNFGGVDDKAFQLHITTLLNLSPELNKKYAKELSAWLEKELGVKHNRGYITFADPGKAYLGFNSTTFEDLL